VLPRFIARSPGVKDVSYANSQATMTKTVLPASVAVKSRTDLNG